MRISLSSSLEDAGDARGARRGEAIEIETADRDRVGAERDRFDDIGAAIEAAIDEDLRPAAHRVDHLGQNIERAAHMIELPPAVIGDVDALDAMVAGDRRVFAGLECL